MCWLPVHVGMCASTGHALVFVLVFVFCVGVRAQERASTAAPHTKLATLAAALATRQLNTHAPQGTASSDANSPLIRSAQDNGETAGDTPPSSHTTLYDPANDPSTRSRTSRHSRSSLVVYSHNDMDTATSLPSPFLANTPTSNSAGGNKGGIAGLDMGGLVSNKGASPALAQKCEITPAPIVAQVMTMTMAPGQRSPPPPIAATAIPEDAPVVGTPSVTGVGGPGFSTYSYTGSPSMSASGAPTGPAAAGGGGVAALTAAAAAAASGAGSFSTTSATDTRYSSVTAAQSVMSPASGGSFQSPPPGGRRDASQSTTVSFPAPAVYQDGLEDHVGQGHQQLTPEERISPSGLSSIPSDVNRHVHDASGHGGTQVGCMSM